MPRTKTYDVKCYELAEHFYTDYPPRAKNLADEQTQIDDLAFTIQQTVEDWFAARETALDNRARSRLGAWCGACGAGNPVLGYACLEECPGYRRAHLVTQAT